MREAVGITLFVLGCNEMGKPAFLEFFLRAWTMRSDVLYDYSVMK